jgi:hypothetical protein
MHPSGNRPSLWTEFWVLTRAVCGIIFWPVLALVALILGLLGLFYLFATHWAFGLLGPWAPSPWPWAPSSGGTGAGHRRTSGARICSLRDKSRSFGESCGFQPAELTQIVHDL